MLDQEGLYDLLIIGGGPTGLNAGLYAKRKGLRVGILTKSLGGQLLDTNQVDNYLGVVGLNGEQLAGQFVEQVKALQVPMLIEAVTGHEVTDSTHKLTTESGKVFLTRAVLLATGSSPRKIGVKGEEAFSGRGVAYCAICDGPLYKGKRVVIVGGGNSAVEAALDLAKIGVKVTLVHRSQFRADQILIDKLYESSDIDILLGRQVVEIYGSEMVEGVLLKDSEDKEEKLAVEGVFIEIGYLPNLNVFEGKLLVNEKNEVLVSTHHETNIEGVFAAGDLTQIPHKQIIIAAGEGAAAALNISQWLNAK